MTEKTLYDALHNDLNIAEVSAIFAALEFVQQHREAFTAQHGVVEWRQVDAMASAYRRQMEE